MIKCGPQAMMISGALLILFGVAAIFAKIRAELKVADLTSGHPDWVPAHQTSFDLFAIRFPGIKVAVMGAALLIVGYLGTRL
jgi:hypothetical protein